MVASITSAIGDKEIAFVFYVHPPPSKALLEFGKLWCFFLNPCFPLLWSWWH